MARPVPVRARALARTVARTIVRAARRTAARAGAGTGSGAAAPDRLLVLGPGADLAAVRSLAGLGRQDLRWTVRRPDELTGGRSGTHHPAVVVGARSLAELRAMLPLANRWGRTAQLVVVIQASDRPEQLVLPSAVVAHRLERGRLDVHDRGAGGLVLELRLRSATSVHQLLRAAVSGSRQGGGSLPAAGLRLGVQQVDVAPWAVGDPWARWVDAGALAVGPDDISPVDLVLGDGDPTAQRPPVVVTDGLPPVDTAVFSPRGFDPTADAAPVDLDTGAVRRGLDEWDVHGLRPHRHVRVSTADADPVPLARALGQLLVSGVPTVTGPLPATVRVLLGDDLADRAEALDDVTTGSPLDREAWSVGTRRAALLQLGATTRWRETAAGHGISASPAPSMSVILASRRPANLRFALTQLEQQTWPQVQVVLALHGVDPEQHEVRAAVAGYGRDLEVVPVGADVVFGDVLNAALDRCTGRLVAKMDDDDWYGPDHLTDLVLAHGYSGATLVGLADHFTYLESSDLTIRDQVHRSEQRAARVSGGTLAVARDDLLALGRWRPVHRAVDRSLIQAVTAVGGEVYATHDLGFCLYRGAGEHTWSQGDEAFLARGPQRWDGLVLPPHVGEPVPR